jgi:chlorite dismutase
MDRPFHSYLIFSLDSAFHRATKAQQIAVRAQLLKALSCSDCAIETYATRGLKAGTTFLLWVAADAPEAIQTLVYDLERGKAGEYLTLTHSFFGLSRASHYSGRRGRPAQDMLNFSERLPYLIVYPFTKTTEWYQLPFEERKRIMGGHIKVGVGFEDIRQCLLYATGLDDHEFIVAYETESLEHFQDLVVAMRATESRIYTKNDVPIVLAVRASVEAIFDPRS